MIYCRVGFSSQEWEGEKTYPAVIPERLLGEKGKIFLSLPDIISISYERYKNVQLETVLKSCQKSFLFIGATRFKKCKGKSVMEYGRFPYL